MADFSWLPPLIKLSDCSGDTIYYVDQLYKKFKDDLVSQTNLALFGKAVRVSPKLDVDNRHERFWHTITDPHNPSTSDIKPFRAERISWIKALIENVGKDGICVYDRVKDRETRLHIFGPELNYLIIFTETKKAY